MSARRDLLDLILAPAPFDQPRAKLDSLRLEAAHELFSQRREQLPVLRRRADEANIAEVRSFHDLIPLLLPHTTYKSYPQSWVDAGRWHRMLQWLNTLSVEDVTGTDVEGVQNVDEWITCLREAGHMVLATSGSSGKCSFLNQNRMDVDLKKRHFRRTMGWPFVEPKGDRPFFAVSPSVGFNSAIEAHQMQAEIWGRPDARVFLTDEPLLICEVSRQAALRKRMAEGLASPSEVEQANAAGRAKAARMNCAVRTMAERIVACRHEPIFLGALWSQHLMIIEHAKELGVGDGEFHPQSVVTAGGGIKGVNLPPDYKQRVDRFYGDVIRPGGYGMTEMAQRLPRCEAKRYHVPPGLIILLLDPAGERLLNPPGTYDVVIEGRFGFLDLLFEGRWGGLITGDKVQVDFSEYCHCGRPGPTVLDTITRFGQPGQDDHIGCAGTIDSYIRGALPA